jgi:hypothetical protein
VTAAAQQGRHGQARDACDAISARFQIDGHGSTSGRVHSKGGFWTIT